VGRLKHQRSQHQHPPQHTGSLILLSALLSLQLSGCTAVTAISAIPGALYSVVANQFSSEEVSFPHSMRATLAATQQSLQTMRLDIDILEIQAAGGYGIAFNNNKLYGEITLRQQTERLTTVMVRVKTITREESIEHAIIELVTNTLKEQPTVASFQIQAYHHLRASPSNTAQHLGWFRPGAMLDASNSDTPGWLQVTMPSGAMAYLNGGIVTEIEQ